MWRIFKTAHDKVDEFRKGRTRQPDDAFLVDCGLTRNTEAAEVALAVRRAVAGVGLVDPLFIHADDSYPGTLEILPLWDSMDWIAFMVELERELGRTVPQGSEVMPKSDPTTVRGLVALVREILERSER